MIRNELLAQIEVGRFRPGDQIPTEPELIARYDVSRTTVRRALRDLQTMGVIRRHPGRGSFVNEPQLEQRLEKLTGFVEDMNALGLDASAKVVTIEKVPASKVVADNLRLNVDEYAIHIERVRLANGQPISFDDSYFPESLGSRIAQENLEVDPFYSILEERYELALSDADYVLQASVADARVADLLATEPGAPILLIERTSFAAPDSRPIIFEYLMYRGDRMKYRLKLNRQ
ncbi:GntR family transcriptional regulator [Jiangella asiatica]|nr:GntR family transcriptional regulator [Jiangella asiatica]